MVRLQKKETGEYQFSVHAPSGSPLLKSIGFTTKHDAEKVIIELPKTVVRRTNFERQTEKGGHFVFCLKSDHGNLIGKSGPYSSEAGMENGIKNLKESVLADQGD